MGVGGWFGTFVIYIGCIIFTFTCYMAIQNAPCASFCSLLAFTDGKIHSTQLPAILECAP